MDDLIVSTIMQYIDVETYFSISLANHRMNYLCKKFSRTVVRMTNVIPKNRYVDIVELLKKDVFEEYIISTKFLGVVSKRNESLISISDSDHIIKFLNNLPLWDPDYILFVKTSIIFIYIDEDSDEITSYIIYNSNLNKIKEVWTMIKCMKKLGAKKLCGSSSCINYYFCDSKNECAKCSNLYFMKNFN